MRVEMPESRGRASPLCWVSWQTARYRLAGAAADMQSAAGLSGAIIALSSSCTASCPTSSCKMPEDAHLRQPAKLMHFTMIQDMRARQQSE